ncbi:hypothetical protein B0A48_00592 [Cryoendolithus antarcticus]|uniref:Uncharacterized protein n=1 Tax=Cryoendolithus antarcticus TaxID=1507870 RepID=A0A1V8TV35_9PEZI|nr:hypothetical protein B0A48_00592 [Cryoendolithus antarcticus]
MRIAIRAFSTEAPTRNEIPPPFSSLGALASQFDHYCDTLHGTVQINTTRRNISHAYKRSYMSASAVDGGTKCVKAKYASFNNLISLLHAAYREDIRTLTQPTYYSGINSIMVSLSSAISSNKAFLASRTRPLVVVIAGATSGIGRATLLSLCRTHGHNGPGFRVYIPARSKSKAEELVEECRKLCGKGDFRFVEVKDLSLLRDVDTACQTIVASERELAGVQAKLDVLIMTQGVVDFGARKDTIEGLDASQSLLLFSRLRFIHSLSLLFPPAATTSIDPATRIVSVYAAGYESASGMFYPQDLSLRQPGHYSFTNSRASAVHMKTLLFEHLAQKQYPGRTNPLWFKIIYFFAAPFLKLFIATSQEEIGHRIVYIATSGRYAAKHQGDEGEIVMGTDDVKGSGAYASRSNGEVFDVNKHYEKFRREGLGEKIVEYTEEMWREIGEGRKFTG